MVSPAFCVSTCPSAVSSPLHRAASLTLRSFCRPPPVTLRSPPRSVRLVPRASRSHPQPDFISFSSSSSSNSSLPPFGLPKTDPSLELSLTHRRTLFLLSLCFSKLLVLGRPLSLARNVGLPYSSVLHCLFSLYILFPRRLHPFLLVIIYFLLTCSSHAHLLISRSMEPTNDRFVHQLMN